MNYKIKIIEGEKSVKQEIEVEGGTKEECITEIRDIYKQLKPFCKAETLEKVR